MYITKKAILLLFLTLFVGNAQALEPEYEIHPEWYMLTCAGFGYHLVLDNNNRTFRLKYGAECPSVTSTVFKGKFKIEKNILIMDFGEFTAYYYIKEPYAPICDNQNDSLTASEQQLICDKDQLTTAEEFLPPDISSKKIFVKKTALFLSEIKGTVKSKFAEWLVKDLQTHIFIRDDSNLLE